MLLIDTKIDDLEVL